MILIPTGYDARTGLFHRLVSADGAVEMGVHKVMYGHRIRAGWTDSCGCELDWCGGSDWSDVERLYSICRAILLQREPEDAFKGLPGHSEIKPFFLDKDFTNAIVGAAGDCELVKLEWFDPAMALRELFAE